MASEDDADDDDVLLALLSEPSESDELVDLSNSFPVLLSTPTGSDEKTPVGLSPEESAWVDSCLVLDAELSDDNWIAFTEALLDTLSFQNSNYEPDYVNGTLQGPSSQITERSETDAMYVELEERDEDADAEDDEDRDEDTSQGNANANAENSEVIEQEAESRESIFKVWDLETLISSEDEDDELIEQLKKLLIGGRGRGPEGAFQQPPYEPSRTAIQEKIIDEVAATMADLSLRPLDD